MLHYVRQLALLLLAFAALGPFSAAAQEGIWHYSPYQVRVWVALAPAGELNAAMEQAILRTLRERAEATALATWTVTPEPVPASLRGDLLAGLEWITVEQLSPPPQKETAPSSSSSTPSTASLSAGGSSSADRPAPPPLNGARVEGSPPPDRPDFTNLLQTHDKLTLVRVAPDQGGFRVEARELDCRTRQWSEVITRRAAHASLVPLEAFRAVQEAFRPLARIEHVRGKQVTVRLRAGGLIENPESPAYLPEKTVLLPVVRFNDRRGLPRENGIQIAPWTYLVPKERLGAGRVECELAAGVSAALGGRSSNRIEKYGLVAPVRHDKTDVIVRARPASRNDTEPPQPLSGYEVHERLPGAQELTFVARTDWRGRVEIGKTDQPVRMLYVKNGGRVLSKFPVVPGLEPRVEVNVMNDDRRLEVEGFVNGLQSRIMDLVVAREVLAVRIRKRLEEKKLDEAETLLAELRALPSRDQMHAELDQEAARQRNFPSDNLTQQHINKLFGDARALISQYLEPTLVLTLERQLSQAKR
jgi:hypothetical protein